MENPRKTIGTWWFLLGILLDYHLVDAYITTERSTIFTGETRNTCQCSIDFVKLPDGSDDCETKRCLKQMVANDSF